MTTKIIDVAVGVLIHSNNEVLFAQRPEGKPMAGYWEFPGGKLELGESVHDALARELHEEIGVDIGASEHWRMIEHVYPHAHVRLHFQIIRAWTGDMHGKENQALHWQALRFNPDGRLYAPDTQPILPATEPLLPELADFLAR
ncbi:MAG: 8-oxo-dGTP diphosphatase MutT [Formosimonas sp.]|jgi:8-oxo-dGTP diphosphatase